MTITNGYATLAEAKAVLWTTGAAANSDEDTVIEDIVMAASRQVDEDTNKRFYTTSSDETRTFSAEQFDCIWTYPIISITSLKTDSDMDGTYEWTWAATDYILLPLNASLDGKPYYKIQVAPIGNYSFPVGNYPGVQIVGKFGYSSTAPKNIKQACLLQCLSLYQSKNFIGGMGTPNAQAKDWEKMYNSLIQPYRDYL